MSADEDQALPEVAKTACGTATKSFRTGVVQQSEACYSVSSAVQVPHAQCQAQKIFTVSAIHWGTNSTQG